jgi:signal peptidase II
VIADRIGRLKLRFLLLSLAIVALDQWTKWLIERNVPLHGSIEILPGLFYLSHVRNTGVAFGLFATGGIGWGSILLTVAVLAAGGFAAWFFGRTPDDERLLLFALALVLGGAVGNLIDRVTTGAVTDFLAVYLGSYRWPDFNVADSAISVGVVLIAIDALRPRAEPAPAPE